MKIGLLGLPQAGKKTLLRLLTGVDAAATAPVNGAVPGICPVRDPRVDRLVSLYRPKKVTPARIEFLLLPDLTKDSAKNQDLFKALQLVDVLALVVRAFADDRVFHVDGSVDPLRDAAAAQAELLLNDLLFVEKRRERLAQEQRKPGGADRAKEQALLARLHAHLDAEQPLRTLTLATEERKLLSGAALLTRKPLLLILNVGEDAVARPEVLQAVTARWGPHQVHAVQVSAKIEEELAQLDEPAERDAFLASLGLTESAIDRLSRVAYEALGLISYFTVGEDEVRAWTVRRGAAAPEAGGVIHSDIERGFIRAEQMRYDDLIALGSEQAVAAAGKAHLKGREYIVEDGDVLSFRFNV
jgi:hypothetical protein